MRPRQGVPKNLPLPLHPRPSYKVPYILPSSVSSKSCVFTLFKKLPGWGGIGRNFFKKNFNSFPFWRSALATRHSSLATVFSFQSLTTVKFCNSSVLITIQQYPGVDSPPFVKRLGKGAYPSGGLPRAVRHSRRRGGVGHGDA